MVESDQTDPTRSEADSSIAVGRSSVVTASYMPLPLFSAVSGLEARITTVGRVRCDQVQVFVAAKTLEEILGHGRSDCMHEVGGWLFGRNLSDRRHSFVTVEASLAATGRGRSPVGFTFTNEDQQEMAAFRDKHYPRLLVIGWYHSHPLGLRLSEVDITAHRSAFREPYQIALVMDLGGRDIGCAVWRDGQVSHVGGFFVVDWFSR